MLLKKERARRKRLTLNDDQKQVYERIDDMMTVPTVSQGTVEALKLERPDDEPLTPTGEERKEGVATSREKDNVGKLARVKGLKKSVKYNETIATIENWLEESRLYTVRTQDLSTVLMVK